MTGVGTKGFIQGARMRSGEILNWKEDGKITGFIHPSGFFPRLSYWLSIVDEEEQKKNKKVTKIIRRPFICPGIDKGCPVCELREFLKDKEDIEDDEVIFAIGSGKYRVEITKGDALGMKDFNWKLSLRPNKEFLFGFIDSDNVEGEVAIVISSAGLARAISNCIESVMDDKGDEEGDLLKNPWAIKLKYKEKAIPAQKFEAYPADVEITDDIQELLDGDGPNLDNLTRANTPAEIWEALKDGIEVSFKPSFLGEDGEGNEEKPRRKKKVKKEKKLKEDDEEKPKKKRKLKVKKEKEKEEVKDEDEDMEPCPKCETMLPLSATECSKCGIEFDVSNGDEDEGEKKDEDNEEKPKKKKCEYCGETVKIVDGKPRRCPECGERLT